MKVILSMSYIKMCRCITNRFPAYYTFYVSKTVYSEMWLLFHCSVKNKKIEK